MNKHRIGQVPKCGAMDSKYFSNPKQFDKDMQMHNLKSERFENSMRALILDDPSEAEERYNQAISILLKIKQECGF